MGEIIMKKTIALIASTTLLLTAAVGCGAKNSKSTSSDREVVHIECQRILYNNVPDLVDSADLIVIGEFIKDSEQKLEYSFDSVLGVEAFDDVTSTNEISIKKILKGSVDSDTIKMSQRYGIDEDNRLITFSEMTPMEKGDQWIFFLTYNESKDMYWASGDYTGRYPVPNDKLYSVCEKVMSIRKECDEALSAYTEISKSQAVSMRQNEQSDKLAVSGENGKYYSLTEKELKEKIYPFYDQLEACEKEFTAEDFGLYDRDLINLWMYSDIINQFDCTIE